MLMFRPDNFQRLLDRFPETTSDANFSAWRNRMREAGEAARDLLAYREQLRAAGKHTARGIAEAVKARADKELAPRIARVEETVRDMALARIRLRHEAADLRTPDPADLAAAMLRREIRERLAAMPLGERLRHVLAGDDLVDAAMSEGPTWLVEVAPEVRERALEARVDRHLTNERRATLEQLAAGHDVGIAIMDGARALLREIERGPGLSRPPLDPAAAAAAA